MLDSIEILGLFATALSCIATIPQIIKIIKTKDAKSISSETYMILIASYFAWGAYGVFTSSISLTVSCFIMLPTGVLVLVLKHFCWGNSKKQPRIISVKPCKDASCNSYIYDKFDELEVANQTDTNASMSALH